MLPLHAVLALHEASGSILPLPWVDSSLEPIYYINVALGRAWVCVRWLLFYGHYWIPSGWLEGQTSYMQNVV